MRHWKIIGASVALLGEVALQMSGFTSLPLAIFLGVVCVGLITWSAYPVIKRIRFQKPIRLTSGKTEANPKTQVAANFFWLEQVLQEDRTSSAGRIYSRGSMWSFKGLKRTDSFVEVIIPLINAAVFPILVEGVSGRFVVKGDPCAQDAQMEGKIRIPHGQSGNIRIRQYLSQAMVNSIIMTRPGEALEISLKSCKFSVQPEIPGELPKSEHIIIAEGNYNLPMSEVLGTNDWFAVNTS